MKWHVLFQVICFESITVMKQVIITGENSENDKMEVLSMSKNATTNVCKSASHRYPLNIGFASGAFIDNKITICGGGNPKTASCYEFSYDHQWKKSYQLRTPRTGSASAPISSGLWVTGGYSDRILESTEIVYFNGTSSNGPPLPGPRNHHCLLRHKKTLLLIGGYARNSARSSTVWIFRADNSIKFIGNGPDMNFVRSGHSCGIYQSSTHDDHPILVVVGGYGSPKSSEYLDFTIPGSMWTVTSKL
jgi:hypothetical protein